MDWQDSGASPVKPLSDAELAAALASLDTESAMALLERQAELRKQQQAIEELARQHQQMLEAEAVVEEVAVSPEEVVEPQLAPAIELEPVVVAEPQAIEELSIDELLGVAEPAYEEVAFELPGITPALEPEAKPEPEMDIAASLNALFGAASVPSQVSAPAEVENVEQLVTELEEVDSETVDTSHLVDDLIMQFGGEQDELEAAPAAKTRKSKKEPKVKPEKTNGRSAWSLIANWNGSGALVVAVVCGYSFAGFETSLGSLLVGGFAAFVILGLIFAFGALAARRGKSFQQVLARASFGVSGNVIPAAILLIARLVGLAVAVMSAALAINVVLPQLGMNQIFNVNLGGISTNLSGNILLAILISLAAGAISLIRNKALEITRLVLAVVTSIAVGSVFGFAELTGQNAYRSDFSVDMGSALQLASLLVVTFGLLFAISAADENSRIRPTTVVPKFLAAGVLNWVLAGLASLAAGFTLAKTIDSSLVLLIANVIFAVLGIFALAAIFAQTTNLLAGLRIPRTTIWLRLLIVLIVVSFGTWLYISFEAAAIWQTMLQLLPVAGVPVAAWLGIFTADVVLRRTDYHLVSLEKNYGFYRGWNIANLLGWMVASALGLGLVSSGFPMLTWVGYLSSLLGLSDSLALANLGIWVALLLGFLVPVVSGIPRIRRQENETLAIEARRQELKDVAGEFDL